MDNFTFADRPSNQRIQLMINSHSTIDAEVVELFLEFQWTYRNMQKVYDNTLIKNDLSESRFIILMFLKQAENQELLPSTIAEKLGATRATVSKLLKAMEAKEWIKKTIATSDKRSLPVQLTTLGNKVLEAFLPENFAVAEKIFSSFSAEEIKQFSYLLNKIKVGTQKCSLEMER